MQALTTIRHDEVRYDYPVDFTANVCLMCPFCSVTMKVVVWSSLSGTENNDKEVRAECITRR